MSTDNRWLDLHMKRQYDAAVADRSEAIRRDPDDAWAFADRGESHRMKGELDRAIADFGEAIRLNSTEYLFFARRGETYRLKGDSGRAIADCTQALRLNPNDFWALSIRAVCYREQGNLARAAEDLDNAVRLNPSDPWILAHRGDTRRRIGDIENGNATLRNWGKGGDPSGFLKTDDYDKAIADLAKSLGLKPDQPQTLNWLVAAHLARGRTHRDLRQFDRAIADCTEAIRLDSRNAEAFAVRGDVRWWRNEYHLAIADLDEALRLDPKKGYKDLLDKVRRGIRNAKAKDAAPSRVEPRAVQNVPVKTSIQTTASSPSSCDPGVYYLNSGSWHLLESDEQLESLARSKTITHSTLVVVVPSENTTPTPVSSLPALRAVVDQYSKPRSGVWSALKTAAKVVGLLGLHVVNETAKRAGAPAGHIFCAKCRETVKLTATVCPHCREDPQTPF